MTKELEEKIAQLEKLIKAHEYEIIDFGGIIRNNKESIKNLQTQLDQLEKEKQLLIEQSASL